MPAARELVMALPPGVAVYNMQYPWLHLMKALPVSYRAVSLSWRLLSLVPVSA